jgi:DUF1365 family protein
MKSAVYRGWVRHRRKTVNQHRFKYSVFMLYLDLAEIPSLFHGVPGWSAKAWSLASFRRSDFMGDPSIPLNESVRKRVEEETGDYPRGPIRMLANLRYFGFNINPIACYYCFNESDDAVQYVVAEVSNTPWGERHSYVLTAEPGSSSVRTSFAKVLHVSPFNPMDMQYRWHSNTPGDRLGIHMSCTHDGTETFDATLALRRRPANRRELVLVLLRFPFMTLKVALSIYWEALKLWLKGTPLHSHPSSNSTFSDITVRTNNE